MDPLGAVTQRVYRDGTRYIDGKHVKDLSALNRPLEQVVIIDDNADCISMQVWCVVWCGPVWFRVVWCSMVWGGVVWCGVVWCGVLWCGMV